MENHRKTKFKNVYEPDSKIWKSVTYGEGISTPVLAPHNARPKTVPLIKWIEMCGFIKCHFSQIITIIIRIKIN